MVLKKDELVAIVDSCDNVRCVTQRGEADAHLLRMRTGRVIIFDTDMRILVHQRALEKPVNGGLYDVGTGETPHVYLVNKGYTHKLPDKAINNYWHETYEHAAGRGIFEEMFSQNSSLDCILGDVKPIVKLSSIDILSSPRNYGIAAFHYDPKRHGPITPERDEVKWWGFLTAPELGQLQEKEQFMEISPLIAEMAFRIIRGESPIPILQKEVYA